MDPLKPAKCPISGVTEARRVFSYNAPPHGEIGFRREAGQAYYREVWQFRISGHFVSCHAMNVATGYTGDYVNATYDGAAGMLRTYNRIINLPPGQSDNAHRMERLRTIAAGHFNRTSNIRLLDVGSGLGVFPHAVKEVGWQCTALDPDPRSIRHIREIVGVDAICGEFQTAEGLGRFDVVTFNKVLEHVTDPIRMLRHAHQALNGGGLVYLELPDGEMAARSGPEREEFFIEHLHVFSLASTVILANRAGFAPILVERLQEPSTKYTLRAYCIPLETTDD
jgi:SAM-dependent methyltransferase